MKEIGCTDCSNTIHLKPSTRPDTDWIKVVCSCCGKVNEISQVQLLNKPSI